MPITILSCKLLSLVYILITIPVSSKDGIKNNIWMAVRQNILNSEC